MTLATPRPPMPDPTAQPNATPKPARLLITAGPTHEAIDAVRFIGNRSSGRLGVELAQAAAGRGWSVTLLLGPATVPCQDPRIRVRRFVSVADLEELLSEEFEGCDVLVMAAAVADYRPAGAPLGPGEKLTRAGGRLTLELESTPDLLAACSARRRKGQTLIGFALEPPERLMTSARDKIARKGLDAIVANPLQTMDAPDIEATLLLADGSTRPTPGRVAKSQFAAWLLDEIDALRPNAAGRS